MIETTQGIEDTIQATPDIPRRELHIVGDGSLSADMAVLNLADAAITEIEASVSQASAEQIIAIARQAQEGISKNYWLRAACAYYYRKVVADKQSRGRGNTDVDGTGIGAVLKELSQEIGVDIRTLQADATIYETFVVRPGQARENSDNVISSLAPSFYRAALSDPAPTEAIQMAAEQVENGTDYSVRDFREDVKERREAAQTGAPVPAVGEMKKYTFKFTPAQWSIFCKVGIRELDLSPTEMVTLLINHLKGLRGDKVPIYVSEDAYEALEALAKRDGDRETPASHAERYAIARAEAFGLL
jgi:hypothetical protein